MAHHDGLTKAQAILLAWVGAGCPQGSYEGTAHRVSAAALARRGLVKVDGHGLSWTATITAAGSAYLERLAAPNPPLPRQADISVTQHLVDEVVAAGGSATFPRPIYGKRDQVDYERRALAAQQHGKVPPGKQLVVKRDGDRIEISLVDAPHMSSGAAEDVAVPERVARLHPIVRRFRDDKTRLEVSRDQLGRACRILHALIGEAERRGYSVALSCGRRDDCGRRGWSGPNDGHVVITTAERGVSLRIFEEGLGSRSYWESEQGRWVRSASGDYERRNRSISEYEAKATGRLCIEAPRTYGDAQRAHRWADRKRWRLEDKLGEVLWEIEVRSAEAVLDRERAELEKANRQRGWEAAMHKAEADFAEHHRREVLPSQLAEWEEAERIRVFCTAALAGHPDDPDTRKWVDWARGFAAEIDPLAAAPRMPEVREPARDDLRPFLGRWSPHGPDGW